MFSDVAMTNILIGTGFWRRKKHSKKLIIEGGGGKWYGTHTREQTEPPTR